MNVRKYILLFFSMCYAVGAFSQTEYYSINGKNRLTKSELETFLAQQQKNLGDQLKGMTLIANTTKTETRKDSIIHFVTIGVKGAASSFNDFSDYLNKPFPEFELEDINGERITLADIKGKPTIVNFWFTSCAPCIAEMPILNKIKDEHSADFNFVALTYETRQAVEKFLEKQDFNFSHIVGAKDFIGQMGISTYPLNFFLNKDGIVKEVKYGIPKTKDENGQIKMGDGKRFVETLAGLK